MKIKKSFLSLMCCAVLLFSSQSAHSGWLAGIPLSVMSIFFHTAGALLTGGAGAMGARAVVSEASKNSTVETGAKVVTGVIGALARDAGVGDESGDFVRWFSSGNSEDDMAAAIALGVMAGCCHLAGMLFSFSAGRTTAKPQKIVHYVKEKEKPEKKMRDLRETP